uniref:Peptidase M6-like domain-containing protein n=1 Tax=Odontella aurita TaxID=265563 RepID=A0A7S4IL49_9STRA
MYNLVLLIRFADHKDRCLPTEDEVNRLFNAIDGDPQVAPSGSVRDCFRYNSYNKFDLQSKLCKWCDVPEVESYYGDSNCGMTQRLGEAIRHCLDVCHAEFGGDFSMFDLDQDRNLDAIAILHSGFGAEWGGEDCYNPSNTYEDRIWSHKWELPPGHTWTGSDGVSVKNYHISPALWDTCGCEIGRIGVICHETGHFFGLPDLYDGTGGNGVGTTCLMGNSWGYSGDQYYPPMMSAWAKLRLGWAEPEIITSTGDYSLASAALSDRVLAYVNPSNVKEYFLIENKQHSAFFEKNLPQTGINIYHIDDNASYDAEGVPGDVDWPEEHYRVAVVQADGQYDLEKGGSFGDEGDVFHGAGMNFWSSAGVGKNAQLYHPYPNTNFISSGVEVPSGFKIFDMSPSVGEHHAMTFKIEVDQSIYAALAASNVRTTTTTTTTTTTAKASDVVVDTVDFGGAEVEDHSNQCGEKNDECAAHSSCCTVPKQRCKYIKKVSMMACKPKTDKKKKAKKRRLRLLQLRREMKEKVHGKREEEEEKGQ